MWKSCLVLKSCVQDFGSFLWILNSAQFRARENVCHGKQPLAKSGPHFTYTFLLCYKTLPFFATFGSMHAYYTTYVSIFHTPFVPALRKSKVIWPKTIPTIWLIGIFDMIQYHCSYNKYTNEVFKPIFDYFMQWKFFGVLWLFKFFFFDASKYHLN